jgi:hypothetical protein
VLVAAPGVAGGGLVTFGDVVQAAAVAGSIGVRVTFMPGLSRSSSRILDGRFPVPVIKTGTRRRQLETTHLGRCVGMIAAAVAMTIMWTMTPSAPRTA